MTDKDKLASKQLQKKYGITLSDYNYMLKEGNGGCWICGAKPKPERRLHVDHDHKVKYYKVTSGKAWDGGWYASIALSNTIVIVRYGVKKNEAIQRVRQEAKYKSVRGLLCWPCNSGLRKWNDNADKLQSASEYLRKYKEKLSG